MQGRIPETTLACIHHLRHHLPRARISVEVEKPGREGLRDLAKEADVVFYSRSWAEVRFVLEIDLSVGGPNNPMKKGMKRVTKSDKHECC